MTQSKRISIFFILKIVTSSFWCWIYSLNKILFNLKKSLQLQYCISVVEQTAEISLTIFSPHVVADRNSNIWNMRNWRRFWLHARECVLYRFCNNSECRCCCIIRVLRNAFCTALLRIFFFDSWKFQSDTNQSNWNLLHDFILIFTCKNANFW